MDREEMLLTLKKNKLDLEHGTLLQDRSAIALTEAGFPITVINLVITAQLFDPPLLVYIAIAVAVVMGIMEHVRRRNSKEIRKKYEAIDVLLQQIERQLVSKTPH